MHQLNVVHETQDSKLNVYGSIDGVEVGMLWKTRDECSASGVHKPIFENIHEGSDGAYSIVLCGNINDIDLGECFSCTGEEVKKWQISDDLQYEQIAKQQNIILSRNFTTGSPVRVVRGWDLNTKFAPEFGYRYDGLYVVVKDWRQLCSNNAVNHKYVLKRCSDQLAPPWKEVERSMLEERKSPVSADSDKILKLFQRRSSMFNKNTPLVENQTFFSEGGKAVSDIKCQSTSNGHSSSVHISKSNDALQSCLKKSDTYVRKRVTFKDDPVAMEVNIAENVKFCNSSMENVCINRYVCHPTITIPEDGSSWKTSSSELKMKLVRSKHLPHAVVNNKQENFVGQMTDEGIHVENDTNAKFKGEHIFTSSESKVFYTKAGKKTVFASNFSNRILKVKLARITIPNLKDSVVETCNKSLKIMSSIPKIKVTLRNKSVKRQKSLSDIQSIGNSKRGRSSTQAKRALRVNTQTQELGTISEYTEPSSNPSENINLLNISREQHLKAQFEKQYGPLIDCKVKLEKLSLSCLRKAISGTVKLPDVSNRENYTSRFSERDHFIQLFSRNNICNTKQLQRFKTHDRSRHEKQLHKKNRRSKFNVETLGNDHIDSWGNVRCASKQYCDLSENVWHGWWVRVDSLCDPLKVNLHTICDGETESRNVVWDDTHKEHPNFHGFEVPVQIKQTYEKEEDCDEDWNGWNVLFASLKLRI